MEDETNQKKKRKEKRISKMSLNQHTIPQINGWVGK